MAKEHHSESLGRVRAIRRAGAVAVLVAARGPDRRRAGERASRTRRSLRCRAPRTPTADRLRSASSASSAKQIKSVSVTGSETGNHAGSLKSYKSRTGASFIPDEPFTAGETVSAKVVLQGRNAKTDFTVATPPRSSPPSWTSPPRSPTSCSTSVSARPGAAEITVNKADPDSDDGSIFLTPLPSPTVHAGNGPLLGLNPVGPGGPMIIDGNGNLVWFKQLPTERRRRQPPAPALQGKRSSPGGRARSAPGPTARATT